MATSIPSLLISPDLKQALSDIALGITTTRGDALIVDATALQAVLAAVVTDIANLIASHNTLIAKLNLDAGVTDTNYAAATAQTSTAPDAITAV